MISDRKIQEKIRQEKAFAPKDVFTRKRSQEWRELL
jgi:hypothetical protein